jgi:hypothetical protein
MLRGSLVIPDDATQPTTPYLIRKNDKVVLDRPTKCQSRRSVCPPQAPESEDTDRDDPTATQPEMPKK